MKNFISLCLLALCCFGVATAQHKKDSRVKLVNHVIRFNNAPRNIEIDYPQVESKIDDLPENLQRLLSNINRDVCQNIAESVEQNHSNNIMSPQMVTNGSTLELFALAEADASLNEQAEFLSPEAFSYGLYSQWEAYANDYIVTIAQTIYTYSGGQAHGNTSTILTNYRKKTGNNFSFNDIIEQKEAFMYAVRKNFCKERQLSVNAPMGKTGLFMELAELPFPQQIGLGLAGLKVIYQPYEIAPYAAGVIEITIPYKSLEDILPKEFFDISSAKGGKTIATDYND